MRTLKKRRKVTKYEMGLGLRRHLLSHVGTEHENPPQTDTKLKPTSGICTHSSINLIFLQRLHVSHCCYITVIDKELLHLQLVMGLYR